MFLFRASHDVDILCDHSRLIEPKWALVPVLLTQNFQGVHRFSHYGHFSVPGANAGRSVAPTCHVWAAHHTRAPSRVFLPTSCLWRPFLASPSFFPREVKGPRPSPGALPGSWGPLPTAAVGVGGTRGGRGSGERRPRAQALCLFPCCALKAHLKDRHKAGT